MDRVSATHVGRGVLRAALACGALVASCKTVAPPPVVIAPVAPEPAPAPVVALPTPAPLPAVPTTFFDVKAPDDNALTAERADLGWRLFFDKRLSKDGSMACSICHHADKAYTSGYPVDTKVSGVNTRNTSSIVNMGYHTKYFWDGRATTLEAAITLSLKEQLGADPADVARTLDAVPQYQALFKRAYDEPPTAENVPKALASFLRAVTSGTSAWDRFFAGDTTALTAEQQQGQKVFNGVGCANCHSPPLFTDGDFHNVGISKTGGRHDVTGNPKDIGAFKTPSLRNVALTGPYFHDGSVETLDEAMALMAKGGHKNPNLDADLSPVKLSARNVAALKAFLLALSSDPTIATSPNARVEVPAAP